MIVLEQGKHRSFNCRSILQMSYDVIMLLK